MASGFDGEDLSDFADALRPLSDTRPEEKPRPGADELRMLEEAEENRGRVVGADVLGGHNSFYDGRLLDASDVHCRLESGVDAGRVEQHHNRRLLMTIHPVNKSRNHNETSSRSQMEPNSNLEVECGLRLEIGSGQDHPFADVGDFDVEGQRSALAGPDDAARRFVPLDRLHLYRMEGSVFQRAQEQAHILRQHSLQRHTHKHTNKRFIMNDHPLLWESSAGRCASVGSIHSAHTAH